MENENDMTASSTHPGVDVVRTVLEMLNWSFRESAGEDEDETVFLVDTRGDELLAFVKVIHSPGRVVLYGVSPLKIETSALPAAWAYASLANNAFQAGCLCVRQPVPAEVSIRTNVNYTRVEELEEGLVAGAISDLIDLAEVSFEGLEAVAQGMDADEAFDSYMAGE